MAIPSSTSDALVGQVVDERYEVVRRLARGGMATVYVAHDLRLSRTVALKVMHEGLGDAEDFASRFDAEARAAAHLVHPNVVSVFDQGVDGGRPYIVMEFVEGSTLRQLITREAPMDPLRVLDLAEPVVSAIAAAHAAGLIHRDVKPENVLISDRGQVKVADFGLARVVTAQSQAASSGLVIGTVSYIAPELVTRGRADARSDVYSLGIVLYEMLTGRKPHTGDSPIQVAYSHVHNQIPAPSMELSTTWREGRAGIPPYLDALVTTAANRERENRPSDAGVLLDHLRAARSALARGVTDDPALVARMRQTRLAPRSEATAVVPALAPPPERRFTPSTPVSPTFDVPSDGAPFLSSGPMPYSPQSPHTHRLPVVRAAEEPQRRRVRWGRLASVLVMVVALVGLGWGGWYLVEGRWMDAPRLAMLNQTDAQTAAAASGLTVTFEREYSEDVPVGQVTRTDPAEGERVLRGGHLTAYLSRGPERYAVPKVVGLPLAGATETLTSGFLATGAVTEQHHDTVAVGTVISQSVEQGEQVKRDTPVDLVVSKGPAPVTVQDFTGKPLAEASAWFAAHGLTVSTSEENSSTVPAGSVITQDPATGTMLRGDTISVVASKGPVLVQVPVVRGKAVAQAQAELQAAGFQVQLARQVDGALGLALGTSPEGGTMAPQGSTVTLIFV